ncbi:MAG: hypothetical protein PHV20_09860 [Bacteroidales bacterium]|nr:hypothetical protein [Bacteroidales bacterium]
MGVSIHYRGRIADQSILPHMVEEVEEIARVHKWKYQIYNREFPVNSTSNDELFGIIIQPSGCEPVNFTFLANGRLCGAANLACWGKETKSPYTEYLYMN